MAKRHTIMAKRHTIMAKRHTIMAKWDKRTSTVLQKYY
jgi:hypothetical protein